MTPAKATDRMRRTEQNGRGAISTMKDKAGDASSVVGSGAKKVGSGAKKVVGAVAENPLLAATGAAVLGAAIGGTALARERRQRTKKASSKRSPAI